MCTGTPVHYEQTIRKRVARPWLRVPDCANYASAGGRYTMRQQSDVHKGRRGGAKGFRVASVMTSSGAVVADA